MTARLASDHAELHDTLVARRYLAKFGAITSHLGRVAAEKHVAGKLTRTEAEVLAAYMEMLSRSFRALSDKYLLMGRLPETQSGKLTFDKVESGFPVAREFMEMAADAAQAEASLRDTPSEEALKDRMVEVIVRDLKIPTHLQFALSRRHYNEALASGALFWPRNEPKSVWIEQTARERRRYLIHWAVYDGEVNLPVIYLMEVEDAGRIALPKDAARWPEVKSHLSAQALAGLKLLTIARGFDQDFDDLHPKRLRRFHVGPMYSSAFTKQEGPIRAVLEQAASPAGEDWALAWTEEDLVSEREEEEPKGWFGRVQRQVFALDPFAGRGADTGASATRRSVILPARPFQALAEMDPPGFRDVEKYVVSPGGRVLRYR